MASITGYLNVELGRLETYIHQSIFHNKKDIPSQVTYCQSSVLHQLLRDPDAVILDNFTLDALQVSSLCNIFKSLTLNFILQLLR